MKKTKAFFIGVALVAMGFNNSATLTEVERQYASSLLQETRDNLITKVSRLTPEQLNFKADAGGWSVAECVEHIAISESSLFELSQRALKEPASPSKPNEVKMSDQDIVNMFADRNHKSKTSESLEPTGKFGSYKAALKEFKTKRDNNIKYIETTSDDLRNHYNDFPFGKVDAYQTILIIASHTRRHTDQIEEVMKNENFPK